MNCPNCDQPLTPGNTTVTASIADHDHDFVDITITCDDCKTLRLETFVSIDEFVEPA